jgi:hypothetical protein
VESDPIGLYGGSFSTYNYVNAAPLKHTDQFGLGPKPRKPPKVSGSDADDVYQYLADTLCDWWLPFCYKGMWVCVEARCKYTDACGNSWYVTVTQWTPSWPTPEEVTKETPECVCTKKGPRREN